MEYALPLRITMRMFCLSFALFIFITGCHKTPSPPPIPEKDTTSLATQRLNLQVILTHSRDTTILAADTASRFGTSDTIHGIIRTENARQGTSLVGRWYYLKTGQKIAENGATLEAGSNMTHFDLLNERPWPQGQYKLLILVDSAIKDSATFSVANKKKFLRDYRQLRPMRLEQRHRFGKIEQ